MLAWQQTGLLLAGLHGRRARSPKSARFESDLDRAFLRASCACLIGCEASSYRVAIAYRPVRSRMQDGVGPAAG